MGTYTSAPLDNKRALIENVYSEGKVLFIAASASALEDFVVHSITGQAWYILPPNERLPDCISGNDIIFRQPFNEAFTKLPDFGFNIVVLAGMLANYPDQKRLMRQAIEKTAPGGFVIADAPNFQYWPVISSLLSGNAEPASQSAFNSKFARFFTLSSIEELFISSGLIPVELWYQTGQTALPEDLPEMLKKCGIDTGLLEQHYNEYEFVFKLLPANYKFAELPVNEVSAHVKLKFSDAIQYVKKQQYTLAHEIAVDCIDIIARCNKAELLPEREKFEGLKTKLLALKAMNT